MEVSGRSYITVALFTLAVGLMLTLAAVTTPPGRGYAAVLPIHFSECIGNRQACGHLRQVNIFNTEGTDPREAVDLSREKTLRPIARLIGTTASTFLLPLARLIGTTAFHLPVQKQLLSVNHFIQKVMQVSSLIYL